MTSLIRIGNSQGIRIPKSIIEQAHLKDHELELKIVNEGLLIHPVDLPRKGWKEEIEASLKKHGDHNPDQEWLDADLASDEDWEW